MLESASERLRGAAARISARPTSIRSARLESIRAAGEQRVPFTSGILIGIGETREERIDALLALRDLHDAHGHIQEIIIQNFRPKPGTRMADAPAPSLDEHLWTIAIARLHLRAVDEHPGAAQSQPGRVAPPDRGRHQRLGRRVAGHARSRESGGAVAASRGAGARHQRGRQAAGRTPGDLSGLRPRRRTRWVDPALRTALLHRLDADGWPRTDDWSPGSSRTVAGRLRRPAVRPVPRR